jgi:hypothetical protein
MTTETPLLLALGLFAFYSALGDIMKAMTNSPMTNRLGCVFKLAAPFSAGFVAFQAGRGTGPYSLAFTSWSTMKSLAPYMGILLIFTFVLLIADRAGMIKLDDGAGGAGEPPSVKPTDDAAD